MHLEECMCVYIFVCMHLSETKSLNHFKIKKECFFLGCKYDMVFVLVETIHKSVTKNLTFST